MGIGKRRERHNNSRYHHGVFRDLVISYIWFALLLVIALYISMFAYLFLAGGGNPESLAPYELVDEAGNVGDISSFTALGGWIERLDAEYHVLEVYGEKQDGEMNYTQEQIYEYLSIDADTPADYQGFLKTVYRDGATEYFLMKIDRNTLTLTYTFNLNHLIVSGNGTVVWFLLLFLALFTVSCLLLGRYLSGQIRRPLREITEGMEQVRQGKSGVRLDFKAQKEFEEIRDYFNQMMEQLELSQEEKRVLQEKRDRLLLELSHDIKTPAATIKSYASVLKDGLAAPEDVNHYYQIIDQKADRVSTLVDEMFLFLKYENPEYELHLQEKDLCEIVRQVCAGYYEQITGSFRQFTIDIPEKVLYAKVDQQELGRALENLIGNAVKYNQTGTEIAVSVSHGKGNVTIAVKDDGEPVSSDIQDCLFDPFVRGDEARQTAGGTGLGLSIASKILEKHGGTLTYGYEDGYNIFSLCLPLSDTIVFP